MEIYFTEALETTVGRSASTTASFENCTPVVWRCSKLARAYFTWVAIFEFENIMFFEVRFLLFSSFIERSNGKGESPAEPHDDKWMSL